jgi:hypothetical protein
MQFNVPTDRVQLKQQVLRYIQHMQAFVPNGLAQQVSARYIPGDSAAEASVAVRLLTIEPERLREFEAVMDAVGADVRKRDDERTIRLDNWPARWASTHSVMPLVFVAGPKQDGTIYAEFFAETADVPDSILQHHPDGRLFNFVNGIPT